MSFAFYTEIHFKTMWVTTMLKLAIKNCQALIAVKTNLSFQQCKFLFSCHIVLKLIISDLYGFLDHCIHYIIAQISLS